VEFEFIKRKMPASLVLTDEQIDKRMRLDRAAEQAKEYASEAMMTLVGLMRGSHDEKVRMKCAMTIIERAYGAPRPAVETNESDSIIEILARVSSSMSTPLPSGNPVYDVIEAQDGPNEVETGT
jgi:hypothetical protein